MAFAARLLGALDQAALRDEVLHAREAGEVLDRIQEDQRSELATARDGRPAGEALGRVALGGAGDGEFHCAQQVVVVVNEGPLPLNGLAHAGLREVGFAAFAGGFVRQRLANLQEIVRTRGILPGGEHLRARAQAGTAAAEQVSRGAQLGAIEVGQREHSAAPHAGDLRGVDFLILGLAAMAGLQREGVAEDKGTPRVRPEVGAPLPAQQAFDCHHQIVALGRNHP